MATGNINITTHDAWIKEVWVKDALENIYDKTMIEALIDHQYQDLLPEGDKVNIPNTSAVTVGTKTPGTDVTYTNYTETVTSISLGNTEYFAFVLENSLVKRYGRGIAEKYIKGGSANLGVSLDTAIGVLIQNAAITQNVGAITSSVYSDITDAVIRNAIQTLDEANAPENDRFLVISPKQKNAILGIDKFTKANEIGDQSVIRKGLVGELYGVMVYVSNLLASTTAVASSSGAASILARKDCMMFQREAFALVAGNNIDYREDYQGEKLGTSYTGEFEYGLGVVRPKFAVNIRTTAE